MRVLLLQLDGKLPNIALMRVAAHHAGDEVVFQHAGNAAALERGLFDRFDRVYASLIFTGTRHLAERLLTIYPDALVGGTGWDVKRRLEEFGITTRRQDYRIYPHFPASIGFSQRGCRLRCPFCCVPEKEGAVREENTIAEIWRGGQQYYDAAGRTYKDCPRHLILLDNDFFGQARWRERIAEIRDGGFRVSFSQGINARMLTDETAAAIGSVLYYDDSFRARRIYTAWDNRRDEHRLFAGLRALVSCGVKPDHIMVYILVGYDHSRRAARPFLTGDDFHRHARLREFGCRPYPMPYVRTLETVGFQRWIIGAYDKRVSWAAWQAAKYQPANLGLASAQMALPTLAMEGTA